MIILIGISHVSNALWPIRSGCYGTRITVKMDSTQTGQVHACVTGQERAAVKSDRSLLTCMRFGQERAGSLLRGDLCCLQLLQASWWCRTRLGVG